MKIDVIRRKTLSLIILGLYGFGAEIHAIGFLPYIGLLSVFFIYPALRTPRLQTPVLNLALSLWIIGLAGYISSRNINELAGTSLNYIIDEQYLLPTLKIFGYAVASLIIGAIIAGDGKPTKILMNNNGGSISTQKMNMYAIVFSYANLFISLKTYGLGNLLSRDGRLLGEFSSFITNAQGFLSMASFALLCFVVQNSSISKKKGEGALARIGIILFLLLFLSLGSRKLSVAVIILLLTIKRNTNIFRKFTYYGSLIFLCIASLHFVLQVRRLTSHGLIPYISNMTDIVTQDFNLSNLMRNILSSFMVNGITAFNLQPYPLNHLFIELNPLPGRIVGWNDIRFDHSINRYTPTGTLGDLWNYSPFVLIIFFISLGFIVQKLAKNQTSQDENLNLFQMYFLNGTLLFIMVNSLQYSLRSTMRLVYALIVVAAVFQSLAGRITKNKVTVNSQRGSVPFP